MFANRFSLQLSLVLCAATCQWSFGQRISPVVAVRGVTPSGSCLRNFSLNADFDSAIDPGKPTIVITHGWNPFPNHYRLTTPEAYARKIRDRHGLGVNVLTYHWESSGKGSPRANVANAIEAGRILGCALLKRGIVPERTWLIGHSMGTIVMTSSANLVYAETERCMKKLTLIDCPKGKATTVVRKLRATDCATEITNIWASGLSGLGAPMCVDGVINIQAPQRQRRRGKRHWLHPARNNHIDIVLWFYETQL